MAYLAANQPVYNPPVPYRGHIAGGLQDGHTIVVQGNIHPNPNDFRIDLCRGAPHGADTIFVFNPRFNQREVVRNTCQGGGWGGEEKHGGFPFHQGQGFEVKVEVTGHCYRVFVNNQHFCDYNHRAAMQSADCLSVEGSINITSVVLQQRARVRATGAPVPFSAPFPGGLQHGNMILVRGQLYPSPKEFRIDLTCGMHDSADVAYVFNPRFHQNEVVRNTCQRGNWGPEEKHGGFPFYPGQGFEVRIDVDHHRYRTTINGQQFPDYNHRYQPLHSIDCIKIQGDIQIHEVLVQ